MIRVERQQSRRLQEISRQFGLSLIIAFGSQVRGTGRPDSDLDLGVMFEASSRLLDVLFELQKVFPSFEVDVANLNRADPLFLHQINQNCQLLSGSEERFREFRRLAFHRYQDFRPYLRLEAETNRQRLERLA